MNNGHKLDIGEEYLSISILKGSIKLVAFKNKEKKNPKEPDYSGDGIGIWVNKKKVPVEKTGLTA